MCGLSALYTIFTNNIVAIDTVSNPLSINIDVNGNTGRGNVYGFVDSFFTNLVILPLNGYSNLDPINSNFAIKIGSSILTAGIGGSQPGIYGGPIPFQPYFTTGNPAIPQVSKILLSKSDVSPGDTIQVTLQAESFK